MNCSGPQPKVKFHEQGNWYPVNYINYGGRVISILDQDVQTQLESGRCDSLRDFTVQPSPSLSINVTNTSPLFKCKRENSPTPPYNFLDKFLNHTRCGDYELYFDLDTEKVLLPLPENFHNICSVVHLPPTRIPGIDSELNLTLLWNANFRISWNITPDCSDCHVKRGRCLSNPNGTFLCGKTKGVWNANFTITWYVSDDCWNCHHDKGVLLCSVKSCYIELVLPGLKKRFHLTPCIDHRQHIEIQYSYGYIISLLAVLPGAVIIVVAILVASRKNSILPWKKKNAATKHIEAFFKNHGSLAPKQYRYNEVKIMTHSFKNKLGQGGYGSVFKGMLKDGRLVAVKVLCENKGNGEEFINEVASISRTSHVNIVNLLGYCFEGSKRALVYEYMSNGSLEKYIYVEKPPESYSHLRWETLHQIAVGIARGLEYLHRGCNTRILHFDIKPHNILLDEEFCPKISDFGLAKLCTRKESIISMLGGRGTAGYIAPEVFSRNFGGISHKSDVYSYGMMILEMVGARKNIDVAVDHTSEIYFPSWIYKRIELDEDLGLHGVLFQAERQITRKMILVGLWCIQTNPSDRPSMSRVLEMLEGSVEVLSIPPKPFLSSPPRGQEDTSIN
ncbi:hypothetical protein IFM89_004826 [Coptis chinensis]|uniref:Protein kinase domain-containing protein n=1 Tax=Coptis chinensis TaxID=261450 RepID=A0A835H4N0_9MAGN|nr:hypothetical protein IFM89_004826 [Coptis chinensis]